VRQRLLRGGEAIAEAEVEAACIDLSGRARRPPPDLVEALKPFFA
jgi:acyl-CoA thioester hydrolase